MTKSIFRMFALFCVLPLFGCITGPRLNIVPDENGRSDLVIILREIACEVAASPQLSANGYIVTASLVLKSDNTAGLTPSLSFIHPLHSGPNTSQTTGVGGEISRTNSRQYSQTFQINAREVAQSGTCDNSFDGGTGKLGLGDIVTAAFDPHTVAISGVHLMSQTKDGKMVQSDVPSFGSTIVFTFKRSVSGAPTWNRVHFHGPTSTGNLFSTGRTDTNTLTIAFVPNAGMRLATQAERDRAEQEAAGASWALLQQLILQNATLGH